MSFDTEKAALAAALESRSRYERARRRAVWISGGIKVVFTTVVYQWTSDAAMASTLFEHFCAAVSASMLVLAVYRD